MRCVSGLIRRTCASPGIWSKLSGSPLSPAPAFITMRRMARRRSASLSARRKRRSSLPRAIVKTAGLVSPVLESSPCRQSRGSFMANRLQMIPENTRMEANGEGAAFDITGSATRTFLCRLTVTDQIEQESLDVSIWGSADGETWTKKPLLKLPQQFYRGTTKLILDL